jgi:hypothetical protein
MTDQNDSPKTKPPDQADRTSQAAETTKLDADALRKLVVSTVLQIDDEGHDDDQDDAEGDVAAGARKRV